MLTLSELLTADRADVHRSPHGTVSVWRPAKTVLACRAEGLLTKEGAQAIEAAFRRVLAEDGRAVVFHDWYAMYDFEAAARVKLTLVAAEFLAQTEAYHLVLSSRLVAVGVQTANLVLKKITVHPTPEAFAQRLYETVQKKSRG